MAPQTAEKEFSAEELTHDMTEEEIKSLGYDTQAVFLHEVESLPSFALSRNFRHMVRSFEGERCPLCQVAFDVAQVVALLPCGHFMHRSCVFYSLTIQQTCLECLAPVFPETVAWSIKEEIQRMKEVEAAIQTHQLQARPELVQSLNVADFHILSDRFAPRRPWQSIICGPCQEGYQVGQSVIVSDCGHYMHFSCAVEVFVVAQKFQCVECRRPFWTEDRVAHLEQELAAQQGLAAEEDDATMTGILTEREFYVVMGDSIAASLDRPRPYFIAAMRDHISDMRRFTAEEIGGDRDEWEMLIRHYEQELETAERSMGAARDGSQQPSALTREEEEGVGPALFRRLDQIQHQLVRLDNNLNTSIQESDQLQRQIVRLDASLDAAIDAINSV